ncbi:pSer/pThr/pTyr-binding forkhead associated (FHA) protein [Arcanobacterium pluranimalium]|uniref:FHA domain-containing protein n=1 Tax=Arcanobacterium pluranimalium TaxID=108028 RepID=UPI0023BAEFC6|nr:FHA domain-containing protein [Arcanobacterium pluranimalium]MBM7825413.1 pSer/pThr/pTyr-binding forkhead associated (FHA) protein [Arcanobacterium pluranimalium]
MSNEELNVHMSASSQDPSSTSRFTIMGSFHSSLGEVKGLDADDRAAIEALPASSALLIVRRGPNYGARFLLNSDETVAGRHPKSDIFLDDVTVSRRHAHFVRQGNQFYVRDAHSLNGTYVNQELVEEALLTNGDEVRIGKYQLTFFASPKVAQ